MKIEDIKPGVTYHNGTKPLRQVVMIYGNSVYYRKPKKNVVAYSHELDMTDISTFAKWAKGEVRPEGIESNEILSEAEADQ